ncbi:hypothetical protein RAS1_40260 [Phycisphaerae bacterium RAS1]|nr:hypothetical protein RAS1_40260 [Phycisphaerae bacterium RAS1]
MSARVSVGIPARGRARAALLLEVVIALTIMVAAIAMLGSQLVNGLQLVQIDEKQTRGAELADRMLSLLEMDQELLQRVFTDQEDSGDFGEAHPGYFWRVHLEPTPTVGLGQVTLTILFNEDQERLDSIDAAKPVRTVSLLKADPGKINLATDFGLAEDQMEALNQALPLLGIDPTALNPQDIVSRDPIELFQLLQTLLPIIQQYTGGQLPFDPSQIQSPEQMMELLNQLQNGQVPGAAGAPGGEGQPGSIDDLIRLRDQLGGSDAPAGGAPGAVRPGASPQPPPRGLRPSAPGRDGKEADDRGPDNGSGDGPRGRDGRGDGGGRARGGTGQDQPMSIEDLMRLRDELNAGGNFPPSGGPGAGGRPGGGRPGGEGTGGGRRVGGGGRGGSGNTGSTPGGGRGNRPTGGGRGKRGGG